MGYGWLAAASLLVYAGILAFFIYVATLFFGTKRSAPSKVIALFIAKAVAACALLLSDLWLVSAIAASTNVDSSAVMASATAEGVGALVAPIAAAAIWIPYWRVSNRVKPLL